MKKRNRLYSALSLIAVCGLLTDCQRIDIAGNDGTPIRFKVNAAGTRGTINTTSGLNTSGQSFGIIAVADDDWTDTETKVTTEAGSGNYFESVVKYDGSDWETYSASGTDQTDYMWLNDVGIHFWSIYPISLGTTEGSAIRNIDMPEPDSDVLSFTYTQPAPAAGSDASNQKDILFAGNAETRTFDNAGMIESGKDETVDITFHHALSEIRFAVSTNDGTFDPSLTITKVAVVNAAGRGNCEFTLPSTFDWSNLSNRCDYSQNCGALPSSTNSEWNVGTYNNGGTAKNLYTTLNPFFLIPEDDLSKLSVEVTFKTSLNEYVTKNVALSGSWDAGYYYTYKIEADLTTNIEMSLSLLDWNLIGKDYNYTAGPSATPGVGEIRMTNETPVGSKTAVADTPIKASFILDTPIGATWLVSVTNTDAFEVYTLDGSGFGNSAYGTIQNGALGTPGECVFYIKSKSGIDRSTILSTKIHITVRLTNGTYVNVDDILGVSGWNIILNPLS